MKVMSLFDGISCGHVALDRIGGGAYRGILCKRD